MISEVQVEALCVGSPAPLPDGKISSIDKTPVDAPVHIGRLGLDGDSQSDRKHHGGEHMAVHHYPADHYQYWRDRIPEVRHLNHPGAFGENIYATGLTEEDVFIGDRLRLGPVLLEVSMGRQPCATLERHFQRKDMVRRIIKNHKCGWYYRVLEEGTVDVGEKLELVERPEDKWSVKDVFAWLFDSSAEHPLETVDDLLACPALGPVWRTKIAAKAARLHG